MMMDDATRAQVDAAEPDASTWLSANAGSGKTRVLTDRVARLLLSGVEPQNILCLTYTKAAASEMQNRLFKRLGEWSMTSVEELREQLTQLGVQDVADPEALAKARRLFARAIETPGGLRIQTIHSYCASLLRRFPLEAGISPAFKEMDDRSAALLQDEILEELAETQPALIDGIATYLSGDDLSGLVRGILSNREAFTGQTEAEVFGWFSVDPAMTTDVLLSKVFDVDTAVLIQRILPIISESDKSTDLKTAERLLAVNWDAPSEGDLLSLFSLLLFGASAKSPFGPKIGSLPTKATQAALGPLLNPLNDLMQRVAEARDNSVRLYAALKAIALHRFAAAFLPAYEAQKQRRGWLDFDDLILKTRALLSDAHVAQWVLYRLDGGLDHILVDEAQDTSPAQWQVIERLAQELTAGLGARDDTRRTIFVVGDKKQSIYSFQGADPREFDRMRDHFSERLIGSDAPIVSRDLVYSFRSSDAVLRFVDGAVEIDQMRHRAFHEAFPGRVDLWPVVPKTDAAEETPWYDPVDLVAETDPNVVLAKEIAAFMKRTIGVETLPDTKGNRRKVRAGDFLILVRRRSDLFAAIIRECKALELPVAGADRLRLGAELAVKDIGAVLAFLATPEDDLSLAAALKSPLFGWDEAKLYDLAAGRGEAYLWQELRKRGKDFPETFAILSDLRNQSDYLRPYDLIERILTRHDGRRRLLARLGAEAEDGIDQLLAQSLSYEKIEVPSLTGFLTWLETGDIEVKRQLDGAGDQIRVMTVHGAKGLEAPIVILPDTAVRRKPNPDPVITLGPGQPVWHVPAAEQPDTMREATERSDAQRAEEQERLFYVAATRAEAWLIIAAAGDAGKDATASWHAKADAALRDLGSVPLPTEVGLGLRYQHGAWDRGTLLDLEISKPSEIVTPDWVSARLPGPITATDRMSPSNLGGAKALPGEEGQDEEAAKLHGLMVHRVLELGPGVDAETVLGAEFPGKTPSVAIAEAQRVFDTANLAHLFAASTLSEVPLSALGMSGVIDKLLVTDSSVTAIDFKTNAVVPQRPEDTPEGLLRQMGAYSAMLAELYPNRQISVQILWTRSAQLMELPHRIVRDAWQRASTS